MMKTLWSLVGLLLVFNLFGSSLQLPVVLQEADGGSSWEEEETLGDVSSDMKRHSEGTFSNDYSKYLEERKAQDFVHWLMNNKRSSGVAAVAAVKRSADRMLISDVNPFLRDVKNYAEALTSGPIRRAWDVDGTAGAKRHVDGSFTSDVNKVLDSMAAKEYLLWVMTSKPSGDS